MQNTDTSLIDQLSNLINHEEIGNILDAQSEIAHNLRISTETLFSINELSRQEYRKLVGEYEKHTKLLKEMKQDLDYIFQNTRQIKAKLDQHHPNSPFTQ